MSAPALRPYLPADAENAADVFRAAIEVLAEDDYSDDQRSAWMGRADDVEAFGQRLAAGLTLVVASADEGILGFGSLAGNALIDMLYTRPDFARRGVASLIMDALERLAAARGTAALKVDASDTAQPFFAARGYTPVQRNTVIIEGEWIANTTMEKKLIGAIAPKGTA